MRLPQSTTHGAPSDRAEAPFCNRREPALASGGVTGRREAWLLLNGVLTSPLSVLALAQRDPWPGGVHLRAVVHGLTPVESKLAAKAPASAQLDVLVRLLRGDRGGEADEVEATHFLNSMDTFVLIEDRLEAEGIASPVLR